MNQDKREQRLKRAGFKLVEQEAPKVSPVAPTPRLDIAVALERRLTNWRTTVRMPKSEPNSVCAFWARAYLKALHDRQQQLALELKLIEPTNELSRIADDELDGWLVEYAVRSLANYDETWLLRQRYVWSYSDHWIKSRLKIRRQAFQILHARALQNLLHVLDNVKTPGKIRANNLHAGIDPRRLATIACPDGQVLPNESWIDQFNRLTDTPPAEAVVIAPLDN